MYNLFFNYRKVHMKKYVFTMAAVALLSACGSTKLVSSDAYNERAVDAQSRQDRMAEQTIAKIPDWMSKLPKSTNAVYENGTAVSADMAMADMMAKTIAYAKICVAAGGKVRSQTKMFGTQDNVTMEITARSICPDVDISGVETVDMKHIAEGGRYRTYALVALPLGAANTIRKEADARRERELTATRAPEAFKELDSTVTGKTAADSNGTIKLLPVDNEEYKARRDSALQKPNAVIGQTTLR
jgi:hypothetical protein